MLEDIIISKVKKFLFHKTHEIDLFFWDNLHLLNATLLHHYLNVFVRNVFWYVHLREVFSINLS